MPIDFANGKPGRLKFDNEIKIAFAAPEPPPFQGQDEDLEIPNEGDLDVAVG
jgi:hypothetical protein